MVIQVRLSVRNLPLNYTDADLKQLFVSAVKEAQATHPPADKSLLQPTVKQAKIVRDTKRIGAEGAARSKRFVGRERERERESERERERERAEKCVVGVQRKREEKRERKKV